MSCDLNSSFVRFQSETALLWGCNSSFRSVLTCRRFTCSERMSLVYRDGDGVFWSPHADVGLCPHTCVCLSSFSRAFPTSRPQFWPFALSGQLHPPGLFTSNHTRLLTLLVRPCFCLTYLTHIMPQIPRGVKQLWRPSESTWSNCFCCLNFLFWLRCSTCRSSSLQDLVV